MAMQSEANVKERHRLYINGQWVAPAGKDVVTVVNPCSEEAVTTAAMGNEEDVDRAVRAARAAFPAWSRTPVAERVALLKKIAQAMAARQNEIGDTIATEMGMPAPWSRMIQGGLPVATLNSFGPILESYPFEYDMGRTRIVKEPIGVCGFITPWNYPLHQIIGKVAPALGAGCTMVVKPSQLAPLNAFILAEIMEEVGLPPGVFNLVSGAGSRVGNALASHPDVDMVSLTGSTSSGVLVAQAAARTIKRVTLELGGKSPNVLLEDADVPTAVLKGDAFADGVYLGPMVDHRQQASVRSFIETGVREGATLVTGGPGQPENLPKGYYIRPTVFAGVRSDMTIAREEIFGPVLCILPYRSEEEAIEIANDTVYGLSGSVWSRDPERAHSAAKRIRSGQVFINGADFDIEAPAGGYKQSGIGRERSKYGLEEYLEIKAVIGPNPS